MPCTAAVGAPKVLLSHPTPARSTSHLGPSIQMLPDVAAGPSSVLRAGGTLSHELTSGPQPYPAVSPPGKNGLPFHPPLPYPTLSTGKSSQVPPGYHWPLRTSLRPCGALLGARMGIRASTDGCWQLPAVWWLCQSSGKLCTEYCTYTGFSLFFFPGQAPTRDPRIWQHGHPSQAVESFLNVQTMPAPQAALCSPGHRLQCQPWAGGGQGT